MHDPQPEHVQNKPNPQPHRRSMLGIGLALLLVCAAFFSGLEVGSGVTHGASRETNLEAGLFGLFTSATAPDEEADLAEFWRVWNLLEQKYVAEGEPLSEEERIQGAISGLVDSYGDPYTVFFPPTEASEFEENISGNFSGVGMEVGMRDGYITVIAPLPDTPAEKAGLLPGDIIVRIDEQSTERMSIEEAVTYIRGEQGTAVTLTVVREGENDFLEFEVIRDNITIPTIDTELRDGVFIISLYSFNALAEALMQDALREYVTSGADQLVLDLRGNPGGYLQSANAIASFFLPTGKVIVRESFGDQREEVLYRSQGRTLHSFAPEEMVVLIDEGSASASEILAGALQEHGVATLIGEPTFGKGSVQELIDLPDGSSLKVTIARWLTPNGRSISEKSLEPDLAIPRTVQHRMNDEDPQLEAALRWLSGERDFEDEYAVATSTELEQE